MEIPGRVFAGALLVRELLVFLASFAFVGLKSLQQIHVQRGQLGRIVPTSMVMALFEVYVVVQVARVRPDDGLFLIVALGLGSGLGATLATWAYRRKHG